jgi:hypothetical protein
VLQPGSRIPPPALAECTPTAAHRGYVHASVDSDALCCVGESPLSPRPTPSRLAAAEAAAEEHAQATVRAGATDAREQAEAVAEARLPSPSEHGAAAAAAGGDAEEGAAVGDASTEAEAVGVWSPRYAETMKTLSPGAEDALPARPWSRSTTRPSPVAANDARLTLRTDDSPRPCTPTMQQWSSAWWGAGVPLPMRALEAAAADHDERHGDDAGEHTSPPREGRGTDASTYVRLELPTTPACVTPARRSLTRVSIAGSVCSAAAGIALPRWGAEGSWGGPSASYERQVAGRNRPCEATAASERVASTAPSTAVKARAEAEAAAVREQEERHARELRSLQAELEAEMEAGEVREAREAGARAYERVYDDVERSGERSEAEVDHSRWDHWDAEENSDGGEATSPVGRDDASLGEVARELYASIEQLGAQLGIRGGSDDAGSRCGNASCLFFPPGVLRSVGRYPPRPWEPVVSTCRLTRRHVRRCVCSGGGKGGDGEGRSVEDLLLHATRLLGIIDEDSDRLMPLPYEHTQFGEGRYGTEVCLRVHPAHDNGRTQKNVEKVLSTSISLGSLSRCEGGGNPALTAAARCGSRSGAGGTRWSSCSSTRKQKLPPPPRTTRSVSTSTSTSSPRTSTSCCT